MPKRSPVPPEVIKWLAEQGRKTKGMKVPGRKRGDKTYYADLARLRWASEDKTPAGPH